MIRNFIAMLLAVFALNAFAAVDANQASRADLETVKGIGPGMSGKILEARKAGEFKDWPDLVDRVGGIGARNASKLSQAGLTVRGTPYDGQAAGTGKTGKAVKVAKADKADKADKSDKATKKAAKAASAQM